jgi:hypothetical protein
MLLFYVLNIYSVYFCSQLLQMSPLISPDSHNDINLVTVIYGSVIAVGISLTVYQLTKIPDEPISAYTQKLYICISHLSAIAFALLGELPSLNGFALTRGCWERLPFTGKIIICCVAVVITILVLYQMIRSYNRRKIFREVWPFMLITTSWVIVWISMITQQNEYHVHIHHALFGSFFACFFWDFTSKIDVIANAAFMGITIEGIDFYGIAELHLFILRNNFPVRIFGVIVVWCVVVVLQSVVVKYPLWFRPASKKTHQSEFEIPFIATN